MNEIKKYLISKKIINDTKKIENIKGYDNSITKYKTLVNKVIKEFNLKTPIDFGILNDHVRRFEINNDIKLLKGNKMTEKDINNMLKKYKLPSQQEYINTRNKILVSKQIKKLKKKLLHNNIK